MSNSTYKDSSAIVVDFCNTSFEDFCKRTWFTSLSHLLEERKWLDNVELGLNAWPGFADLPDKFDTIMSKLHLFRGYLTNEIVECLDLPPENKDHV